MKVHVQKISWVSCLFLCITQGVVAQIIPNAGGLMQQMPIIPPAPSTTSSIEVLPRHSATLASSVTKTFVATRLNVRGARAYSESDLIHVAGFEAGQTVSLQTLYDMAEKISQRYRGAGYLVAQAYVPAQEIIDGVVTITVLEGQYGQIKFNNTSTLDTDVSRHLLDGLNPGDTIITEPLENRLLRLSDVPGVQSRSTLVPGASVGLSDLIVEIKPGERVSGSVDADNAGNRYTGENRMGATVNLNNPSGLGDLITLRALTSGAGLHYVRGAYQAPVGQSRIGLAYSDLAYKLGREFDSLDANGRASITTFFGNYPLIRSRNTNLNVGLALDNKVFQDRVDVLPSVTDKRAQVLTATLYGEHRDAWGGAGLSSYSLACVTGNLNIKTPATRATDASTAASDGQYSKLVFAVSRAQQATQTISLIASLSGQVASKNLDMSEKMELGGMYGVRAYPEGEAYADQGYLLTLEARKQLLLPPSMIGQVHLAAFIDTGAVQLSHFPWTDSNNSRHISGAGVGAYWTRSQDFSVKAFYARKLGNENALSAPDKLGRFWVQAVKYF
jgi:hemolysin activation/secretion protein